MGRAPSLVVICMRSLAGLILCISITSCAETPTQGFEAFFSLVADGSDGAFQRLSLRARTGFADAARKRGQEPARFLVSSTPKSTVRTIAVVEQGEHTALLDVKDALGNSERVHMVREDGQWRVDLDP